MYKLNPYKYCFYDHQQKGLNFFSFNIPRTSSRCFMCIVKEVKHLLAAKEKERKNLRNINFVPFFTTIVKSIAIKIDNDAKDISLHAFI